MENKEALHNLLYCKCEISQTEFVAHLKHDTVRLAIKALDKQIPKRPHFYGDGYDGRGNMAYDFWGCPNCEWDYEIDDKFEHCPRCGQHIEWRVDDE